MQAQAKICPICIDDHGAERLCSYAEMRYRIEDLQASITEARAEIAAKDARIAELEAFATEQNRERTEAIGACQERIAQLEAENEALRAALTVERDATIQRAERAERAERDKNELLEVRQSPHEDVTLQWRGIESGCECLSCGGAGVKSYPSTATWRGGIGGQMFTTDVCDKCWGSGDRNNAWPSHRALVEACEG